MAERPIFAPGGPEGPVVLEIGIQFRWVAGMSAAQKQKRAAELRKSAEALGYRPLLEISTKSDEELGRRLSAFNLQLEVSPGIRVPVEVAYQRSKLFDRGSIDVRAECSTPRQVRKSVAAIGLGPLHGFEFNGEKWDLHPPTAFYDWLYVSALIEDPISASELDHFAAFSDIEFNPKRQVSCQARSAALFLCLRRRGWLTELRPRKEEFLQVVGLPGPRGSAGQGLLL